MKIKCSKCGTVLPPVAKLPGRVIGNPATVCVSCVGKPPVQRRGRRLSPAREGQALLSPEQVAIMLGVGRATVDSMNRSGQLPYITLRQGRRKRLIAIRRSELEKFLDKNERRG